MISSNCIPQQQFKEGTVVVDPKSPDFQGMLSFSASNILTGTADSYKCTGNEGSKTSFASKSQTFSNENYSFPKRQYNSLVLSCEDGGNQKQVFIRISKRSLEVSLTP